MAKERDGYDKKYDQKRAGQRTRNWTVVFYPEDLPENWQGLVDELHFRWIEGPLHDKDVNADGKPKKPHHHTLFMFDTVKSEDQVCDMLKEVFGKSETGSIIGIAAPQKVADRCAIVRYMAHMDNPEKVQYDIADIVGHNGADPSEVLRQSATEKREMIIAMEEFIEQHEITELADFSRLIRYDKPEWHTILTTQMTMYFSSFIRSFRYKVQHGLTSETLLSRVDTETGEILE